MFARWMILLMVASLALGVTLRDDDQKEGAKVEEKKVDEKKVEEKKVVEKKVEGKKVKGKKGKKEVMTEEQLTEHFKEHVETHKEMLKKEYKDQIPLAAQCCKVERLMPSIIKNVPVRCYKSVKAVVKAKDTETKYKKICPMFECILDKFGLLSEDKTSVKEEESKKYFVDRVTSEIKNITASALDKCFTEFNENPAKAKTDECKSGAGEVFGCAIGGILVNCPKTMWHKVIKPECREE